MPKIGSIGRLRIVIWPNDHRPAHVHVVGRGGEAVFNLHCPGGPPRLRESFGFGLNEVRRIENALSELLAALCAKWNVIHGNF